MKKRRGNEELPEATEKWGWKFHHVGIPTNANIPSETYIQHLGIYVCGYETSPFGIEWMRFVMGCPLPELVKTIPHLAFEVPDLDFELRNRGFNIIIEPNTPSPGVRVAMIEHNGAPVELMEFTRRKS